MDSMYTGGWYTPYIPGRHIGRIYPPGRHIGRNIPTREAITRLLTTLGGYNPGITGGNNLTHPGITGGNNLTHPGIAQCTPFTTRV